MRERVVSIVVLCAHFGLLAGCANSEGVYGNIYEGLKTREAIVRPLAEQKPVEKSISYQKYESERKKILESDYKQ